MKKQLPIGISTLSNILPENYIYVDKTQFVSKLLTGKYYFLSRPRRFGKSLFIDTLKQAFLGNQKLFEGLYLEKNWDWEKSYPVIHLSFGASSANHSTQTLHDVIDSQLNHYASQYDVVLPNYQHGLQFDFLIKAIAEKQKKQVVILVDEYDKPILDVIDDPKQALENREKLKGLYSVIKDNDAHLRFVFLTGVTKFSKVGLFSGLNNLEDLTLNSEYANICGYTQADLEQEFDEYLQAGGVDKEKLKLWYNGYNFGSTDEQKVYNPFDILLFLDNGYQYKSYWFETGSPAFLIKLIQKNQYYFLDMESEIVLDTALSSFDVNNIALPVLLFQAGYLTIKKPITIGVAYGYELTYPNLAVKSSLNSRLIEIGTTLEHANKNLSQLALCLNTPNLQGLDKIFQSHFASIPNDWYRNNNIQQYEGYYASIVYSYFSALGYHTIAEDKTNVGCIDLTVIIPDKILILEFKLKKYGDAQSALKQIQERQYAQKYLSHQKPIHLIGMSFDQESKNMDGCVGVVLAKR